MLAGRDRSVTALFALLHEIQYNVSAIPVVISFARLRNRHLSNAVFRMGCEIIPLVLSLMSG